MERSSVDTQRLPLLLTIREAAQLIGRPERVLYRWAAEGRLPGVKRLGRAVFIAQPELLSWLGANRDRS